MTSTLEKNIWSIFNEIIEPGTAENDTKVIWANQNIPESKVPNLDTDNDFYVTLDLISGPSRVGYPNREITGTDPDEKLVHTLNTIMTISVSVYARSTSAKTVDTIDTIQNGVYLETVKVKINSFGMAFSSTAGIIGVPLEEDNVWISRKTIDLVFLSTSSVQEDIDIIETVEVDGFDEGILTTPPAGGP